jgi:hypothetical protein
VNYLDIIFLVSVVNITDTFSGVSSLVISSFLSMPRSKLFPHSVGYLTVNFLDDFPRVSPSDIPIFCLPSDGGYSGYYVGHLTVTVIILGLVSEDPR